MLIAEAKRSSGRMFDGSYRVTYAWYGETRFGLPFGAIRLGDMSGTLQGYLWLERCRALKRPKWMDRISARGRLRQFRSGMVADLQEVDLIEAPFERPVVLIPASRCPRPECLGRLATLVDSLTTSALVRFVNSVLGDDEIGIPFVSIPASLNHHHRTPGGLLVHSLECAEAVGAMLQFQPYVRELGVVAALFHDLGKIKTLAEGQSRPSLGYLIAHDFLTLEVLSNHLRQLDTIWPDGGNAIRYILTWNRGRRWSPPLTTIAEAVQFADHCSTGIDIECELFFNRPDWQRFANTPRGGRRWRPRPPLSKEGVVAV